MGCCSRRGHRGPQKPEKSSKASKADDRQLPATSKGTVPWLQQCLQKVEMRAQADANGFSVIHSAALNGRLDCLKTIVEKYEVDVNLPSLKGWRPIHLVMNKESGPRALECLQYLIGKGADVNVQNQTGASPLHKAASEGRLPCIIALVEAGADIFAKDAEGHVPVDLCKLWAHRSCARYLTDAMWKKTKRNLAREMHKLQQIKSEWQRAEAALVTREKMEKAMLNRMAFSDWLQKKQQRPSLRTLQEEPFPEDSADLGALPSTLAAKTPSEEELMWVDSAPRFPDLVQLPLEQAPPPWNASTNPLSPPVADIYRATTIRLGAEPEASPEHDFSSFLHLSKDPRGRPLVRSAHGGRLASLPELPYDVVRRSIFPASRPVRMKGPQDFRPAHILGVPRKRLPHGPWRWTDEMAMSLRETLDPEFIAAVRAHLAAYDEGN